MAVVARWLMGIALAALLVAVPLVHFRSEYAHHKRLRTVAPDVLYRSGQMTAEGFLDAVARYGLRTVINCQNEFPDPELAISFWDRRTVRESEVCRELGVRYVHLDPDLCSDRTDATARPRVIDQFLAVLDDPAARPVLLHCKAGLHRTGILAAVYRMEYEGWGPYRALEELKAHGFGDSAATAANDYVKQYILNYRPRPDRGQRTEDRGQRNSFLSSVFCPLSSVQGGAP
jgi:tyrosine-protein phosphatase SIW14